MAKRFLFLCMLLCALLLCASATAEHRTWKDYFPDYRLGQLMIYKDSKPSVSDEQFWEMARERNVNGWAENRLISVMQLLEYAHDGQTNHPTYMRGLFLGSLHIDSDTTSTIGARSFHTYVIRGEGMQIQPLTIVFETTDGGSTLVECERPYKQEVAPVDKIDRHYGIKLFDYGHQLLEQALEAIERGDARLARSLVYGVNEYDSGNYPGASPSRQTFDPYPEQKIVATFHQGAMPVYAGPGKGYKRLANGKATLGSDSWCYWYGNSGDWALVEYELSKGGFRTGWVYYPDGRKWQANQSAAYFQAGLANIE